MKKAPAFGELVAVRFFKGDKAKRARAIKSNPGRWENDSAFIRAAVQQFIRELERERCEKYDEERKQNRKVNLWELQHKKREN